MAEYPRSQQNPMQLQLRRVQRGAARIRVDDRHGACPAGASAVAGAPPRPAESGTSPAGHNPLLTRFSSGGPSHG
eukprot:354674-Chlamydomonas_euryale.AAC.6